MSKELLEKIKLWKNPDGSFRYTVFVKDAMLVSVKFPDRPNEPGKTVVITRDMFNLGFSQKFKDLCSVTPAETEDQLVARETSNIKLSDPTLVNSDEHNGLLSDLPQTDKRKWIMKQNNKIEVDHSIKTKEDKRKEQKVTLRAKLKAQGLSDDEINLMVI